jgi:hypothetical protein
MRHHGILKPRSVWALRLSAVLAGLVSVYTHAMAQDGLAQNGSMLPAVSSLNASFSVEGGLYDNDEAFVALGSVTAPAGHNYAFSLMARSARSMAMRSSAEGFTPSVAIPRAISWVSLQAIIDGKNLKSAVWQLSQNCIGTILRFAPLSGSSTSPCRTGSGP